jgi:Transglycosylase SLT domain
VRAGLRHTAGAVTAACALTLSAVAFLPGTGPDPDTWIVSTEPSADIRPSVVTGQDWAQAEPSVGMPQSTVPRVTSDPGPVDERPNLPVMHRVGVGSQSIPAIVLAAYRMAADKLTQDDPSCGMRWQVLAGIGKVESGHAGGGRVTDDGDAVPRILGPLLNGVGPIAAISDHDDGRWDLDPLWDRAVGPMQFIPGTWSLFGVDGSGDGVADPNNVFDAALSAGRYLCVGDSEVHTVAGLAAALRRYNDSASYVATVMSWIDAYDNGSAVAAEGAGAGSAPSSDPSASASPTLTPATTSATPKPSTSPTPSPPTSPSPTSPSPSPTPSVSPSPTSTATPTPTLSPTPTPTSCPTPSPTPTPTPTNTPSPTATPTPTPTPTSTPTPTPTPAPSGCPTPGP